ncbi:MAG: NAD(P)H-hydrate dehydratase [candidate division Zixibacteria bacterium]
MYLVTSESMRAIDREAIDRHKIPSLDLMEKAGQGIAERLLIHNIIDPSTDNKVAVICGKGNNGGDGFVVARYLHEAGVNVCLFFIGPVKALSEDASVNHDRAVKSGVPLTEIKKVADIEDIRNCSHIIDAVFGTGFKGRPRDLSAKIIEFINEQESAVISIDMPSGLNADNGNHQGAVIRADYTFALALPKYGLFLSPGSELAGVVDIVPIGIPDEVMKKQKLSHQLITAELVSKKLPERDPKGHKGDFGKLLVISGSTGMTGAACLCANSALRTGCGIVRVGCPQGVQPVLAIKLTEVMTQPLPDISKKGVLALRSLGEIRNLSKEHDAIAIGPGLGLHHETQELVRRFVLKNEKPIVVDADALTALSTDLNTLRDSKAAMVLTPHAGEFQRLTGETVLSDINEIQERFEVALEFAKIYNVTLLLKGSPTIIACPNGNCYLNPTGNHGMATAGSGDVLTGIIGSLLAQAMTAEDAAVCGAFIHGTAGDIAADALTPRAMIAGDMIDSLPEAFESLE